MNLKHLCTPLNRNQDGTYSAKCPCCRELSLHIDNEGYSPGCSGGCDPQGVEAGCSHATKYNALPQDASQRYERNEFNERRSGNQDHNSLNSLNSSAAPKQIRTVESLPDPLDEAALIGPAGDFVRLIEPHTESDPVAILVQFLVAFSTVIGRNAFADVEASQHYTNEFAVLVGDSAKARKGTSAGWVRRLFEHIEPEWAKDRMVSGLSSGEGVIWAVRDPVMKSVLVKEKGAVTRYQEVMDDPGESDKRLLVTEEEFASSLSERLRLSWLTFVSEYQV